MHDIASLDQSSLEEFRTELITAGFEPGDGNLCIWTGPIADDLKGLTSSRKMSIVFRDGWPFRAPSLFVDGLDQEHVSASGEVCLWRDGDSSCTWRTLDGFIKRITEWTRRTEKGFQPEDFALDAHLFFSRVRFCAIATVKLKDLRLEATRENIGIISATWKKDDSVLEIVPGRKGRIEGRWYRVGDVKTPPRELEGVRSLLTEGQRNNFDRRFRAVEKHGKNCIFVVIWKRQLGMEVLVLMAEKCEEGVACGSIEVAPTDLEVPKAKGGTRYRNTREKMRCCFRAWEQSVRTLLSVSLRLGWEIWSLSTGERLRPGNVVRHATGSWSIGDTKVVAVRFLAQVRAPWTRVEIMPISTWNPATIEEIIDARDLVIDGTGLTSFTNLLSVLCERKNVPLVSSALYRSGSIMRVRRQTSDSCAIYERMSDSRYPVIPPETEHQVFEPGCSSPVNNASPVAVAASSALTAEVAIDLLTGRSNFPEEIIEVYRPLEIAPFDTIGRMSL